MKLRKDKKNIKNRFPNHTSNHLRSFMKCVCVCGCVYVYICMSLCIHTYTRIKINVPQTKSIIKVFTDLPEYHSCHRFKKNSARDKFHDRIICNECNWTIKGQKKEGRIELEELMRQNVCSKMTFSPSTFCTFI